MAKKKSVNGKAEKAAAKEVDRCCELTGKLTYLQCEVMMSLYERGPKQRILVDEDTILEILSFDVSSRAELQKVMAKLMDLGYVGWTKARHILSPAETKTHFSEHLYNNRYETQRNSS